MAKSLKFNVLFFTEAESHCVQANTCQVQHCHPGAGWILFFCILLLSASKHRTASPGDALGGLVGKAPLSQGLTGRWDGSRSNMEKARDFARC